jgi:hypothetical protein
VALVTGLRIRGARTDTTTIALGEGIRFDPKDVIPTDGTCRSLRIRHALHGELPTWSWGAAESYWLEPGKVPPLDRPIGPYPGPQIEVEMVMEDGATNRKPIPLHR